MLGLDRYYREQQGVGSGRLSADGMPIGIVPFHWSHVEAREVHSWAEPLAEFGKLLEQASLLADNWERNWLTEYILSLQVLTRWLSGDGVGYEEIVAGGLRIDPAPPTPREITALQNARDAALTAAGYSSLEEYEERDGIPRQNVVDVMHELVAEAKERSARLLPRLRMPTEEPTIEAMEGVPFTAYCDYPGRRLGINIDIPHTRSGLKHLVGHEAYPGHFLHLGHRDALAQEGSMFADATLLTTNCASSVLLEGVAEFALTLIDWRREPEDKIAFYQQALKQACSVVAAHSLNTERATLPEMAAFLKGTCKESDAWVDAKLRFVTNPMRSPSAYKYWAGSKVVQRWWSLVTAADFGDATEHLYSRMHSPLTLISSWITKQEEPSATLP